MKTLLTIFILIFSLLSTKSAIALINGQLIFPAEVDPTKIAALLTINNQNRVVSTQTILFKSDGSYTVNDSAFRRSSALMTTLELYNLSTNEIIGQSESIIFKKAEKKYLEYFSSLTLLDIASQKISLEFPNEVTAAEYSDKLHNISAVLLDYVNRYGTKDPNYRLSSAGSSSEITISNHYVGVSPYGSIHIPYIYSKLANHKCMTGLNYENCWVSSLTPESQNYNKLQIEPGKSYYFIYGTKAGLIKSAHTFNIEFSSWDTKKHQRFKYFDFFKYKQIHRLPNHELHCAINRMPDIKKYISYAEKYKNDMPNYDKNNPRFQYWELNDIALDLNNDKSNKQDLVDFVKLMGDTYIDSADGIIAIIDPQFGPECEYREIKK